MLNQCSHNVEKEVHCPVCERDIEIRTLNSQLYEVMQLLDQIRVIICKIKPEIDLESKPLKELPAELEKILLNHRK